MRPARAFALAALAAALAAPAAPPARAVPPGLAVPPALAAPSARTAASVGGPASTAPAGLAGELDRILADPRLAGATVAVDVRDAATGATLYARNADLRVLPASNQKLLTAAAALEVLGPGYRFRTSVRHTGAVSGGTLRGDLYLHGQGDPTMTYERYDALAAAVARAGVTRVTGRLIADDSWFDRIPLGLDWSWQDEQDAGAAPISALTFAANDRYDNAAVEVRYRPGDPPTVSLFPPTSTVRVVNKTVNGRAHPVTVTRGHGSRTIVVSGAVASAGAGLVSVPDPASTSADLFSGTLRRHGVTLSGRTGKGPAPAAARTLTAQLSRPLSRLLPPLLKLSNNGLAELLVKAMGRAAAPGVPGGWPTGLTAASAALAGLGADTTELTMGDGSGLSRRNWVTARQLTTVLAAARTRPWFRDWHAALPVAGDPDPLIGGTLRDRMRGTAAAGRAHAKTGTLTGVNALSGYVGGTVFSLIANNAREGVSDLLDRIVITLAQRTESGRNRHYRSVRDPANARPPIPQPRHPGPADAAAPRATHRARDADPARRAAGADPAHLVRGPVEPA